jgi:DNA-binding XRE family transcriptional regulator
MCIKYFMRQSPLNHPLAVLRKELGMGQKEMAQKLGCSWRTIQSIELGTLKLSAKLANRISDETSVNIHWLMQGDPKAPIIDERGLPWGREAFFDAQGRKLLPGTILGKHAATDLFTRAIAHLCGAVVAASQSRNIRTYAWKILDGIDKSVEDIEMYPDLVQDFHGIMAYHGRDTKVARAAMIEAAMKVLQQWKEPRGKWENKQKAVSSKPKANKEIQMPTRRA